MKNIWLILFGIASLVNLAGVFFENPTLVFATKPFLMPLLFLWLATETRNQPPRFLKKMTFAGLAFAMLGDVLLMWGNQPFFFMLGLVAFLFTHLSYIGGFSSICNLDKGFLRQQPSIVLPFVAFGGGLVWMLWSGIPAGMKLPVSIYAAVITAMTLSVLNLRQTVARHVFQSLFAGALLFMLSDSLIAWSKFGGNASAVTGLGVMATYIAGQFLIVKGVRDFLLHRLETS